MSPHPQSPGDATWKKSAVVQNLIENAAGQSPLPHCYEVAQSLETAFPQP